jgi:hypothetical protein
MLEKETGISSEQQKDLDDQKAVLESIFGPESDIFGEDEDIWKKTDDTPQQSEGLSEEERQPPDQKPDNETVRSSYWQSEAQKAAAELAKTKAEAEYYKRLNELQTQPAKQEEAEEPFVFPDPPAAPQPPVGYDYNEALSNPQSPSAQYVAQYQKWQADMFEYTNVKNDYLQAVMNERFEALQKREDEQKMLFEQRQQYNQQMGGIREEVMTKFGADESVAADFINKMSSPESLTIENLWKLYQAVYGGSQLPKPPTPDFNQVKNAEKFGPGFNTLPSGVSTIGKSEDDQIFDAILDGEKKRNAW